MTGPQPAEPPPAAPAPATETCPSCRATVPSIPGVRTWCECGWNVATGPPDAAPTGLVGRLYRELGRIHGERLFERVCGDRAERPRPSWRTRAVVVLSLFVVCGWLMFPAAAITVVAWNRGSAWSWVVGVVVLFVAWVTRPRFFRPEDTTRLTRDTHPQFLRLVDDVCAAVGTPPPARVESWFGLNAGAARLGPLQRRTLLIGAPLAAALSPAELVALLGHELAHFENGDVSRTVIGGAAMSTLGAWEDATTPTHLHIDGWAPAVWLANGLVWLLGLVPRALLRLVANLSWADSQRAEYYADRLAATIAGTDAAISSFEVELAGDLLEYACHRVVVAGSPRGVTAEFLHQRALLHPRERARRRLAAALDPTPLDSTHPPTGRRIAALAAMGRTAPRVTLDETQHAAILREFLPDIERADQRLHALHERSMYS